MATILASTTAAAAAAAGERRAPRRWQLWLRPSAGDDAPVDVAAVEALIEERTQLRREHDYDAADAVRDRLKFDFDVTAHDRENEWFVGSGSFGRGGLRADARRPRRRPRPTSRVQP